MNLRNIVERSLVGVIVFAAIVGLVYLGLKSERPVQTEPTPTPIAWAIDQQKYEEASRDYNAAIIRADKNAVTCRLLEENDQLAIAEAQSRMEKAHSDAQVKRNELGLLHPTSAEK